MAEEQRADGRARRDAADGPLGAIDQERLILEGLEDLRDTELRDVMTPRVDVDFLSLPLTPEAVADVIRDSGHSAYPVSKDDELDGVDGVLYVSDLFRSSKGARALGASLPDANEIARKVRRPTLELPESMGVLEALAEMRARKRSFVIVLDEYGGVAGVATLRDLLEPLVGDLSDELDDDDDPEIVRIDADRWLVDGQASVDDVVDGIGLAVPEGDYVTISGYVLAALDRIPEPGDCVMLEGWELRVQSMERRRITELVVRRPQDPESGAGDPAGAVV